MAEAAKKEDLNAVILTPIDVERLLTDGSEDSRLGVLEKVSAHYNRTAFSDREHEIAEQIFRLLMKDAVIKVRETLADRIKENESIPRDIVLHMANDVDSVALPVLAHNKAFSDADLVSIVEASRDISKLLTISKREGVSARVSDALVETHYPDVITTLLGNDSATIGSRAFDTIINDFRGEPAVMEAMVERKQLPLNVVERMVTEASAAIADQLKAKYNLTDEQLGSDAGTARDDVLVKLLTRDVSDAEVESLVGQMAREGRLTPSLVMTALCRGQLVFFAAALGRFAGVPLANAQRLLSDKGDLGFRALYQKSELPDSMADAVRLLLRAVRELENGDAVPGSMLYANALAERVLALAGQDNVEYLAYFIALIRQNIARH